MNEKTKIEKLTIEGRDYIPVDSIENISSPIKIVILQRGWVMVGRFERKGNDCKLFSSFTIRRWGTTNGLGELANEGMKADTVLDKNYGIIEFDYLTVIATIDCQESKWKNVI
jgi:hypothetical protein